MGPDKLLFFGSKATHRCKNFENRTIFRYAHKRSKFYYIMQLCERGQKRKYDFLNIFQFEPRFFFLNLKSIPKMCTFDAQYVDVAQKISKWEGG